MASNGVRDHGTPTGPQADYPVVIGEPFIIDGITHTPIYVLNYDEVSNATFDEPDATGISAAHRTLRLPSYVEVTSLESGQAILVRVERRGPMTNVQLIAVSPDARAQLGVGEGTPVRLRRVNPPEVECAELRRSHGKPASGNAARPARFAQAQASRGRIGLAVSPRRQRDRCACPHALQLHIHPDNL